MRVAHNRLRRLPRLVTMATAGGTRYAVMVCVEDAARRAPILDGLHANIQGVFNEAGLQIMSPNYEADPDGPKTVPKEQWFS